MPKIGELTEAVGHLPDAEISTLAVHCLTSLSLADKVKAILESIDDSDERDELASALEDWTPAEEEEEGEGE